MLKLVGGTTGYVSTGGGTLTISGPITYIPAYISTGNTLRLSNPITLGSGVMVPIASNTLILDESCLTGSDGVYALPPVLTSGATYSSIIIIRQPPIFPPIFPPIIRTPLPPVVEPPPPPVVAVNHPPVATERTFTHNH